MRVEDPFAVLGIAASADDGAVRSAYLSAIQRHPPDRDPEAFQRVRGAYERIKSRDDRLAWRLFGCAKEAAETASDGVRRGIEERIRTGPSPWLSVLRGQEDGPRDPKVAAPA